MPTLFDSHRIAELPLANRVVMAPMTRVRSESQAADEMVAEYYAQRASAGLIVCVELVQLVTLLGHCDVDDLILNLIGVSMGYLLWALTLRRREEQQL